MQALAEQPRLSRRAVVAREAIGRVVFDMMHDPIQAHRRHDIPWVARGTLHTPRTCSRESTVDARIVAATNVPLQEAMQKGLFREDLFYRLGVVEIVIPPLRERGGDALVLARAFLSRFQNLNAKVSGISQEACEAIQSYPWPGNVRQLENRMKRARKLP